MKLLCLLGRHDRIAAAIWWDGFDYRSECRRCGAPLYKRGNVKWRRVGARRESLLLDYQGRQIEHAPDSRLAGVHPSHDRDPAVAAAQSVGTAERG